MKIAKGIVIISTLFFGVFSALIFGLMLFKTSIDPVFSEFVFLLNSAKACFAIFLMLIILVVFILSVKTDFFSVEKIFLSFAVVLISGILIFTVSIITSYKTEWEMWVNSDNVKLEDSVEKYLPYKLQIQKINPEEAYYQISKYNADGVVYIDIYNEVFGTVDYSVEYFEIKDKILNYKFILDREVPCALNDYECEVYGVASVGELDGVKYKLYTDGNNYVVAVNGSEYGYYAFLDNGDTLNIPAESFVKTAIEQFFVVQNLAKTSETF